MPRRSSAQLAILPRVDGRPKRLRPPDYLAADEAKLFRELVASCDPSHFVASDAELLARYVEAQLLAQRAAAELRAHGPVSEISGRVNAWLTIREKAGREVIALAARLRLAPQSRFESKTAGRKRGAPASAYDEMEP